MRKNKRRQKGGKVRKAAKRRQKGAAKRRQNNQKGGKCQLKEAKRPYCRKAVTRIWFGELVIGELVFGINLIRSEAFQRPPIVDQRPPIVIIVPVSTTSHRNHGVGRGAGKIKK